MKPTIVSSLCGLVVAASAFAGTPDPFTPLTSSATLGGSLTQPFDLPAGWTQTLVTDTNYMTSYFGGAYPSTFGNWDMIDFDPTGNFIFIPQEVGVGGGLLRYDRTSGDAAILLQGNGSNVFESNPGAWSPTNDDFGGVDPALWTPFGSVLVAEEWAGNGRMFELTNPLSATGTGDASWRWLSSVPSVSHEGLKFDSAGNLYFVDENSSGSIYKFVPKNAGDLSVGQTFALRVGAGGVDGATGAATWVAMTDIDGNALTTADPFDYTTRGGRAAADELAATGYGRPEDLEITTLANGNQAIFVSITSDRRVLSIELDPNGTDAIVRDFMSSATLDQSGNPIGTSAAYGLQSPDNLAVGPNGEIYIIEDQNPGDIWAAYDADNDGVAESVALFATLGESGSEPTGFILDPKTGNSFIVSIQHPSTGNDALWAITAVPEPSSLGFLAIGLLLTVVRRRR